MSEDKLREELLSWQAGQRELHRWKLIAIGGVAALGLGLTSQKGEPQILVLCLIPFIAAYCDVLLRDYDLRIALIAVFFFEKTGVFAEYERFIQVHSVQSSRWWRLGTSATISSSLGACALTALAGIYGLWPNFSTADVKFWTILASSIIGALLVIWIQRAFSSRHSKLKEALRTNRSMNA